MLAMLLVLCLAPSARAQGPAGEPSPAAPRSASPDSLPAFPPESVRAWQVGLLRSDRLQHATLSFSLGTAFTLATRDRVSGAGIALALGALKELWDSRHGGADGVDLLADAVGATLGAYAADAGPRGSP